MQASYSDRLVFFCAVSSGIFQHIWKYVNVYLKRLDGIIFVLVRDLYFDWIEVHLLTGNNSILASTKLVSGAPFFFFFNHSCGMSWMKRAVLNNSAIYSSSIYFSQKPFFKCFSWLLSQYVKMDVTFLVGVWGVHWVQSGFSTSVAMSIEAARCLQTSIVLVHVI